MPQQKKTLAIDVPGDLDEQIDMFAAKTGQSRARIVNDAIETYIHDQLRWLQDVDAAMADIDSGKSYGGDDVLDWVESWGKTGERPSPRLSGK